MSSEGNIFPSASDSNFAEVGHKSVCANIRAGEEHGCGIQGSLEAVVKGGCWMGSPQWEWDAVGQEVVKGSLMFTSHAGRTAWLCISEVTAILQGQFNCELTFSQGYPVSVSRVGWKEHLHSYLLRSF